MLTEEDQVLLKMLSSSSMMLVQCRKPGGSALAHRILMTVGAGLWENETSYNYKNARLACAMLDEAYKADKVIRTVFNSVLDEIAQRQIMEDPSRFDTVLMAMYEFYHSASKTTTTTARVSAKLAAAPATTSSAAMPATKSAEMLSNVGLELSKNKPSLTDDQVTTLKMLATGEESILDRCYNSEYLARSILIAVAVGLSENETSENYANAKVACSRLNQTCNKNESLRLIFNKVFDETTQRQLHEQPNQFEISIKSILLNKNDMPHAEDKASNVGDDTLIDGKPCTSPCVSKR